MTIVHRPSTIWGHANLMILLAKHTARYCDLRNYSDNRPFTRTGLKTPCYIEAKAAESGLNGAPFQGALPSRSLEVYLQASSSADLQPV